MTITPTRVDTGTRHRDLDPAERTALQGLGVPLDDATYYSITVTWDISWRDCFTDDGKPVAWTAEYYTLTDRPARGLHALEHGPGDAVDREHHYRYGALADLATTLTSIDHDALDLEYGISLSVAGWALHFGGLL